MAKRHKKPWGSGVVVCSGGADSTVLLYMLHSMGVASRAVFFDYGQASAPRQQECVALAAEDLGVPWQAVSLVMPTTSGGVYTKGFKPSKSDNADGVIALSGARLAAWRRSQWSIIEARNSLFVVWAAGLASELDLRRVYVGFQEEQSDAAESDDIDTTTPFVEAVNALLTFGAVTRPVRVVAPFLDMGADKTAIWRLGTSLGVDFASTHSCEFWPACNRCGCCRRRARALASLG